MNIQSILRRVAIKIISQPKANVYVSINQVSSGKLLSNRTIVITGGSKGIGYSIAKRVISEGAKVIITGRNEEYLKNVITELGTNADYIVYDNNNIDNIETIVTACKKKFGSIHSLVLNAGVSLHEGNFLNVTKEGFDLQFNTNLKANYFLAQRFLKDKLLEKTEGNLLFISSETAGKSIDIPYGLTKAAINSLVGGLARRVYQKGIRVNAIAPGVTLTDMTGGKIDKSTDLGTDSIAGRWLLPEEIAEVVCFLLSDASKCITGEVIYCDAGSHLKINGTESEYSF